MTASEELQECWKSTPVWCPRSTDDYRMCVLKIFRADQSHHLGVPDRLPSAMKVNLITKRRYLDIYIVVFSGVLANKLSAVKASGSKKYTKGQAPTTVDASSFYMI